MATIIELNNGRLKRISNRLRGNTGNTGKRLCRYDNDIELKKLRRVEERALREQIEECDLIGPTGLINSSSYDYRAPNQHQRTRPSQRPRRDQRFNLDCSSLCAHVSTVVVAVKPKRPAIKVYIDDNGTMRARPVDAIDGFMHLMGAPAGYVGYDQGGLLSEAITDSPRPLVLIDEYELRA